jgi:hypothetical protein
LVASIVSSLPATIRVASTLTPNEMRALKAATGRSLNDLLAGGAEDMDQAPDRIQSLVWCALRRAGHDCSWDEAGDVAPDMTDEAEDPTNGASSTPSSTSAAGGA